MNYENINSIIFFFLFGGEERNELVKTRFILYILILKWTLDITKYSFLIGRGKGKL